VNQWNSVDEVLDFAIQNEQDAVDFYTDLAGRSESPNMAKVFAGFAKEEKGHKAKLERVKEGATLKPSEKKILDLKTGDYLVAVDPGGTLDYQEALILAMKKEKAAFKLYSDLAQAVDDVDLQKTMLALAQEEAKHKLRFEVEYDEQILKEN